MAQVVIEEKYLEDIADAIRRKTGSNDTYTPEQMAEAINSLGKWNWVKDDGSHYFHLYIESQWQLTQQLNLNLNGTIDWGDGTTITCAHTALTIESHTYASFGKYTIHVQSTASTTVTWGAQCFGSGDAWEYARYAIKLIELGTNCTINSQAFKQLNGLKMVFIHRYLTDSTSQYGGTVLSLGEFCNNSNELVYVFCNTAIQTSASGAFFNDAKLEFLDIPAFIASSGGVGQSWNRVKYFGKGTVNQATYGAHWFSGQAALREFKRLPGGMASLGYQNSGAQGPCCYKVTIAADVTTIPNECLSAPFHELHMLRSTPPTLNQALNVTPQISVIYVPTGSLSAYQTATNWASYADYMVEE